MCHAGPSSLVFFEGCWIFSAGDLQTVLWDGLKSQISKACIDRSDSLISQHKRRPRVTKNTNTNKYIFGSHRRPLKFISAPLKLKHFIGQLWQLMTASNVGAQTQAWQAKRVVFKITGFVCKRFLPFFPTPPRSFTYAVFRVIFDYRSSFFLVFLIRTETLAKQATSFMQHPNIPIQLAIQNGGSILKMAEGHPNFLQNIFFCCWNDLLPFLSP